MDIATATLANSVLILSIGLYFGVICALFGLLVLAGTVGQWALARSWLPALFEHAGTVFVLIALALELPDLTLFGLTCMAWGYYHNRRSAAALNPTLELWLVASALVSITLLPLVQGSF